MKRITIVAVLAFFSAVASTGCVSQTAGTEAETTESEQSSRRAAPQLTEEQQANWAGSPANALELNTHPNDDSQGPHPEPWVESEGPHPEPWTGKKISAAPDPDPDPDTNGSKP